MESKVDYKKVVVLASGGVDSYACMRMCQEEGLTVYPLYVHYGQKASRGEMRALKEQMSILNIPKENLLEESVTFSYSTGGTLEQTLSEDDTYVEGRNLVFTAIATAVARSLDIGRVAIGLIEVWKENFPDATYHFIDSTNLCTKYSYGIITDSPTSNYSKRGIIEYLKFRNLEISTKTVFSCIRDGLEMCMECTDCKDFLEVERL